MEAIYHYIGFFITWFLIVFAVLFLAVTFWAFNSRYYTWLFQAVELIRVYFTYRKEPIGIDELHGAVRHIEKSPRKIIFKKWHMTFINSKIKEYNNRHGA